MARKFKDPRRQALADARAIATEARRTGLPPALHAEELALAERKGKAFANGVESNRELYLRALEVPGATISTVAAIFGVTRQAVHAATRGFERELARHRERDRIRKPALVREHRCRVCKRVGHNAATCDERKAAETTSGDG